MFNAKFAEFIQAQFQNFTDFSQVHWGKNCYWWAFVTTLTGVAYTIFVGTVLWDLFLHAEPTPMRVILIAVIFIFAGMHFLLLPELHRLAKQNQPQLAGWWLTLGLSPTQELLFGLLIMFTGSMLLGGVAIIFATANYFLHCRPLPPGYSGRLAEA